MREPAEDLSAQLDLERRDRNPVPQWELGTCVPKYRRSPQLRSSSATWT